MLVKVQKTSEMAKMPFQKYASDYAFDVYAVSEEEVAPNVWKYGLGLAFQIVRDKEIVQNFAHGHTEKYIRFEQSDVKLGLKLAPRSSVWKTGMVLSNCVGTIDEGYTGEVSAVFYHVLPNMPRYKVGERIGQLTLEMSLPMKFEINETLNQTDRGAHAYGSTGKA